MMLERSPVDQLGLPAEEPQPPRVEPPIPSNLLGLGANARPVRAAMMRQKTVSKPHGHWRVTTFVAGLRSTGLVAPLVLDRPMNGPAFLAYVKQFLAPTLRRGDVVVVDNLAAHKVAGVAEAIRAVGASILYLPPFSPDLDPIEQTFSKLNALLYATAARTKEALWTTIGQLLDHFSPDECRNYFANSGYEFT